MPDYRTHPEYRGLLADVLAMPEEDAPRLILADWLDENGDPGRAEFIRCQIELAARDWSCSDPQCKLWRGDQDMEGLACDGCKSCRPWAQLILRYRAVSGRPDGSCLRCDLHAPLCHDFWRWTYRRGFVEEVEATEEHFLARADEGILFATQPIRAVTLTDRSPRLLGVFCWSLKDGWHVDDDCLAGRLFNLLPGVIAEGRKNLVRFRYRTEAEALADLSQACVRYGRQKAKTTVVTPA